ncbi:hypothetical protein PoB_004928600 [Plakobranchus ocellatus]|uniref:Uncharacterized protein n=1 Tax=Plakobranchus ocellatus TaxID=259542 RepID=A0AAV4BHF9_9GAST|nr:hypothetical protein PoB_004928600 [Plakobranchus ocellatus]
MKFRKLKSRQLKRAVNYAVLTFVLFLVYRLFWTQDGQAGARHSSEVSRKLSGLPPALWLHRESLSAFPSLLVSWTFSANPRQSRRRVRTPHAIVVSFIALGLLGSARILP